VLARFSACSIDSMRISPDCSARFSAGDQPLGVEDQIAAIGAVQSAREDQVEIGAQRTEPGEVFDAADKVLVGRVVLVDDRRALSPAVVDDDIDLIAAEPHVLRLGQGRRRYRRPAGLRRRRLLRQEIVDVFLDVALDRIEIVEHVGQIGVTAAQIGDQAGNREPGGLAVKVAQLVTVRPFPLRHLPHHLFELGLRRLEVVLDAVALLL
jgi:hypothetical protein